MPGLAQLLYEMVAGTPPSFDVTAARIYERLLRGSPESLVAHGLPKELDAVVRRGLSKAPHDRWESVDAFVSALRKETAGAHHVA